MIITQYKVKRIAEPEHDLIHQWQIQVTMIPNWFQRVISVITHKQYATHKTMTGSCLTWRWDDGTKVDYINTLWAQGVVKKRIKNAGQTYVNCRHKRTSNFIYKR
jgi:hypothetical protein